MRFDYLEERGRLAPIIPLRLKGAASWVTFDAYIDTGATFSTFKHEIAEILGINLENGKKWSFL